MNRLRRIVIVVNELPVLRIGGGSPMNDSDLLMTSLPPILPPAGRWHNSSPLNNEREPEFMI